MHDQPDPTFLAGLTDRLRELVDETSRATVADLAGVSPETIRRYLLGGVPSVGSLHRLCNRLELSSEWLLFGRGSRERTSAGFEALDQVPVEQLVEAIGRQLNRLQAEARWLPENSDADDSACANHLAGVFASVEVKPNRVRLLEGPAHLVEVSVTNAPPSQITVVRDGEMTPWRIAEQDEPPSAPVHLRYRRFVGRTYRWIRDH